MNQWNISLNNHPLTNNLLHIPRQEATTSQLMTRIDDLEKQLKETKQTFRKAILTLVERVKTLEGALKRKTKRVLLSNSEGEETEAQGRKFHDLDPLVSLLQELYYCLKTPSKTVQCFREEQDFEEVNIIERSSYGALKEVSTRQKVRVMKAPMTEEEEIQASKKTRRTNSSENAGLAEANIL
ncbi:hypothetical protein Tco_1156540 [Tanacetum coccineum]|uniref:Uncharacterized protein n=1 Tax=Tanacetum coccineum TaxID=301880 RepID=A0ABQ5HUH1_9ASTR